MGRLRLSSSAAPCPGRVIVIVMVVVTCASFVTSQIILPPIFTAGPVTSTPSPTLPPVVFPPRQNRTAPVDRILPGMPRFPEHEDFAALSQSLDGWLVTALSAEYVNDTYTHNVRVVRFPFCHVMALSVSDVQKAIVFASQYNLMTAVRSSGHSYIGRSTADGALTINLSRMKGRTFDLNSARSQAGEVTLESGNSWIEVYDAVDRQVTYDVVGAAQRRVIVGGSAHSVAMGGYTQGGGHSPVCRQLGLAADNLLEATIVLADGRTAVVNALGTTLTEVDGGASTTTSDTDLFWALRGGGGGTWGVVVDFTFRLHYAPQRFRNVAVNWSLTYNGQDIGSDTLRFILQELAKMSPQWGGYIIVNSAPLIPGSVGSVSLFLNHFGTDQDASNEDVTALLDHNPLNNQWGKTDVNYDTFIGYEQHAVDADYTNVYTFNKFVQQTPIAQGGPELEALVKFFMGLVDGHPDNSSAACTGAMIGGAMTQMGADTPVNPKFRSGLLSLTCVLSWEAFSARDSFFVGHAMLLRDQMEAVGEGSYFNEPAEDLDAWKTEFWGDDNATYTRLLEVKRKWDPKGFFWCHNCVGSDE